MGGEGSQWKIDTFAPESEMVEDAVRIVKDATMQKIRLNLIIVLVSM